VENTTTSAFVILQVVDEQDGQPLVRLLLAAAAPAAATPAVPTQPLASQACQMELSSAASCSHEAAVEGLGAVAAPVSTPEQELLARQVSAAAYWCLCLLSSLQDSCS
jgi:hypothetical protein